MRGMRVVVPSFLPAGMGESNMARVRVCVSAGDVGSQRREDRSAGHYPNVQIATVPVGRSEQRWLGATAPWNTRIMPFDPSLGLSHYLPAADRYDRAQFRRCGRSGLKLPLISLGLWQ